MKAFIFVLGLTLAQAAQADTFAYTCFSYGSKNGGEKSILDLTIDGSTAKADIRDESWDSGIGGDINPKYKSRGSLKYLKFGKELLVEPAIIEGGKSLRDGSLGGFVRVEGEAEGGFYQIKYICKRVN